MADDKVETYEIKGDAEAYYVKSPVKEIIDKRCPIKLKFKHDLVFKHHAVYQFKNPSAEQKKLTTYLNERNLSTADTGLSYRVLSHWKENGLLPTGCLSKKEGWAKFSLIEVIWIRILLHMRQVGVALHALANINLWIMQWDKENKDYPWFEMYMSIAAYTESDSYIAISANGLAELIQSIDIPSIEVNIRNGLDIMLFSIKKTLNSLNVKTPPVTEIISGAEIEVLRKIVEAEFKEVKVTFSNKRIREIEDTKTYANLEEFKKTDRDLLKAPNVFADIQTKISDGKEQGVEVRRKKRFK